MSGPAPTASRAAMHRPVRSERGATMVVTILVGFVLVGLAGLMITQSVGELDRSHRSVQRSAAFEAAEAGVDDYVAKLTEDHLYYVHFVHPGESTRRTPSGTTVAAGTAWTADLTWTYPTPRDTWRDLGNGYEYNLEIAAPSAGSQAVRITATGRKTGSDTGIRRIEVLVRPASIADFQMIANRDIGYGASATTRGKLYAGIDENGVRHNINHQGTAYADVYAEGSITRSPTYRDGARGYTSANIRTVIKNPINFNSFTGSLVDIQRAADGSGILLDDPSVHAWRLEFRADGTVVISTCRRNGSDLTSRVPTCTVQSTRNVPAIGAIYATQSVIPVGVVDGRVTVASNADIVIGGNISYEVAGEDVLGLIAKQAMIVPYWAPYNLDWSAATIAQQLQWRSHNSDGSKGTMNFTGSTATNLGGYMDMYRTRNYLYDSNLLYLQPPYFPVLEEAYTVLFFRELPTDV